MRQALIAGRGRLPLAVARGAPDALICALNGQGPDTLTPHITFRFEHLGSFLKRLAAEEVTEVCFCGAVSRPEIDIAEIDADTLPLVPVLQRAVQPGDDGALRAIIGVFEEAGFTIRGAHEVAPHLLPSPGVLGNTAPTGPLDQEIALARQTLAEMGQACVVRGATVLAREDSRGTDAMLADLSAPKAAPMPPADDPFNWIMDGVGDALDSAADWLSGEEAQRARRKGADGLFYKGPKPNQDRRADLPTIGPETVRAAAKAGLRGLVLEADGVMVLDRAETIALADESGLFLLVQRAA